jgi:hypothetical protein
MFPPRRKLAKDQAAVPMAPHTGDLTGLLAITIREHVIDISSRGFFLNVFFYLRPVITYGAQGDIDRIQNAL